MIPGLLLVAMTSGSALAQGRIATIDLSKVFDLYWKKKPAEERLDAMKKDIQKEQQNMMDELKRGKADYDANLAAANDQALSPEERDKRKKAADDNLKKLREQDDALKTYMQNADSRLRDQIRRMLSDILKEIQAVIAAKAKTSGFSMVIDTTAQSAAATPVILYSNNENDITEPVLLELNRNAPADTAKADEKPAADEKKKDGKK